MAAPPNSAVSEEDHAALIAQHARLRAETETTIESLDRLIAGLDEGLPHG